MRTIFIRDRDFYHKVQVCGRGVRFSVAAAPEPGVPVVEKTCLPRFFDPKFAQITVLDSVKSGTGRDFTGSTELAPGFAPIHDVCTDLILPICRALGFTDSTLTHVRTQGPNSVAQTAANLDPGCVNTAFLVSGDTSICEFVNGLSETHKTQESSLNLAIVPMGTGNAFAIETGAVLGPDLLAAAAESVLRHFACRSTAEFCVAEAQFPKGSFVRHSNDAKSVLEHMYFFVVFSWGLHASIVADSDTAELRKLGNKRFQIAAKKNIEEVCQRYHGTVYNAAGKSVFTNTTHSYFMVSFVKSLEPGFEISPSSNFLRGQVCVLDVAGSPESVDKSTEELNGDIMAVLHKVYTHEHLSDARVQYTQFDNELRLVFEDTNQRVCVDGTIVTVPGGEIVIRAVGNLVKGWSLSLVTE